MTVMTPLPTFGALRPARVSRRPIRLRKRIANSFQTIELQRHTRPTPFVATHPDRALRRAILRQPFFQGISV